MRAMVFDGPGRPLRAEERPLPEAAPGQLLIRVSACGVCRTDLHLFDGEIDVPHPPRILGHQIVGTVEVDEANTARSSRRQRSDAGAPQPLDAGAPQPSDAGAPQPSDAGAPQPSDASALIGTRVGVPWLGWTCGECEMCRSGRENLCPHARFTGCDIDGGMADYTVADARYCFPIPDGYPDEQAAPLLCAGLIGYRALRMCGDATRIGLYGFGASAHLIAQVAVWEGRAVFAFTREDDAPAQELAIELGAGWAGGSHQTPPEPLDGAIVFAPVGALVPIALRAVAPGGTVVCAGIHMSDIPSFPYRDIWEERVLRSVANLTRRDGDEFLALAPRVPVRTHVTPYPLGQAGQALEDLREGRFAGAAVLVTRPTS
jgi:alcohol dehydrogenase, propanol-preferring